MTNEAQTQFGDRLAGFEEAFGDAQVKKPQGDLPPDGTWQGLVDDFDFVDADSGLYLKTMVKITAGGGEWDGHVIDQIHRLDDPDRLGWVKSHLERLGAPVNDEGFRYSELERHLPPLLDVPIEFTVKTSSKTDENGNPYRNWYVDRRLGDPLPGGGGGEVPADTEGLTDEHRKARDEVVAQAAGGQSKPASEGPVSDEDIPFT